MESVSVSSRQPADSAALRPDEVSATEVPPPPQKADTSNHCKYYSTGGLCGKGEKCRFRHDTEERKKALALKAQNGNRHTLEQRLIQDDQDKLDCAIIETNQCLFSATGASLMP